jgi:hypothetical protein
MSDDLKVPFRTELTVLSADNKPNQKPLGWVIKERNGVEVTKDLETKALIIERDALRIGDTIYVPGLLGGYHVLTIEAGDHEGELRARSKEGLLGILEFGGDDRNAWICIGLVNLRGISKVEL